MNKIKAKEIIKTCFENEYSKANFIDFIQNILKKAKIIDQEFSQEQIESNFQDHIKSYTRLFEYKTNDKFQDGISVLAVNLQKPSSLQKAKYLQRNFIASYLERTRNQAALVAFYSDKNLSEWKFSLVLRKLNLEDGDVKSEFSSPKRMSFLLGKNEKTHTAKKQFLPILENDDLQTNLKNLEEAFSVEKVTKEFFEQYKELFLALKEKIEQILSNNQDLAQYFDNKQISAINFAKKTLGQIVFLYFLQKKGWFGVKNGEPWGSGDKNFLRGYFEKNHQSKNFFKQCLEPLFYEALAVNRDDKNAVYEKIDNLRFPFLNGGLFEPINGYNWEANNINLPNQIFSNDDSTKEGDIGNGILDIFDRYNFTVNENEPLEQEVAVDPEMLGKVFENLLEIKDRKSKGAFYTPREIVHYMCQESLINYLHHHSTLPIEQLTNFIKNKSLENIENSALKIDSLLENIKVCDPAVGSGAFMLGMLNEIVNARLTLTKINNNNLGEYHLKLNTIENSLYGVDIEGSAVDIAKLRLWLALVVEEEEPSPLPNLDYKIMQGNSLLEEYEGIKLFDSKIVSEIADLFDSSIKKISDKKVELQDKIKDYFSQNDKAKKARLKGEIDELKYQLIEATLISQNKQDKILEIQKLQQANSQPFFLWQLEFSDIFSGENAGFDIVIGNPPYIGEKGNKEIIRPIAEGNLKQYYQGKMDIFYFFFHLALIIGKTKSLTAFITTNYYITATGGLKLRKDLKENATILNLINFNELKIFESAKGQHNLITIFQKGLNQNIKTKTIQTKRKENATAKLLKNILEGKDLIDSSYQEISHDKLFDGEECYIRLGSEGNKIDQGIIERILGKVKSNHEILDNIFNINSGCDITISKVTKKQIAKFKGDFKKEDGVFVLNNKEISLIQFSADEKKFLKNFIKNSNISKYFLGQSDEKLLYLNWQFDLENHLNIKKHMLRFKEILIDQTIRYSEGSWPWYSIHRPREQTLFENSEKIILRYRALENIFTYTNIDLFASRDVFFITQKSFQSNKNYKIELKYVLALLNSKLYYHWFYHKGKRKGEMLELYQKPLSEVPIKIISKTDQAPFIAIVDEILSITNKPDYNPDFPPARQKELEAKIDEMVCDLYQLDDEEKRVVLGG